MDPHTTLASLDPNLTSVLLDLNSATNPTVVNSPLQAPCLETRSRDHPWRTFAPHSSSTGLNLNVGRMFPMLGNTFKRPSMENIRPTFKFKPVELSFQGGKGITKGPEQLYAGPVIKQKWVALMLTSMPQAPEPN